VPLGQYELDLSVPFAGNFSTVPPDSWTDYSGTGQFDSAVELSNGNTLLCGFKNIGKRPTAFMVRVGIKGDFIDERLLTPHEDGFSLFKGVATQSPANELLLLVGRDHGDVLERLDDSDQVAARRPIPRSATEASAGALRGLLQFFPSHESSPVIHMSAWFEVDDRARFMEFDHRLQGPTEIVEARTVGMRKAIQLADGSFIIFGSQRGNPPFASIARVYGNLKVTDFALCPLCGSPWIYDGALGRYPNEFVIIQEIRGTAVMSWISLRDGRP
jgi:hypothetical protein